MKIKTKNRSTKKLLGKLKKKIIYEKHMAFMDSLNNKKTTDNNN
jgi:hypothetical protein